MTSTWAWIATAIIFGAGGDELAGVLALLGAAGAVMWSNRQEVSDD